MFEGLLGNRNLAETLTRMLREERFPQSSIFCGPDGIGKKQFALNCAQSLVCEKSNISCGKCGACERSLVYSLPTSGKKEDYELVQWSGHTDVGMIIPNKQSIYIDAIRNLEKEANFRPYEAKKRIFIIEEAEKMSPNASNALLKTLEEPPETTHIILITSRLSSLLPTIRSRSQIFRFAPIPEKMIEEFLYKTRNYSSADALLAARIAKGSIVQALGIAPDELRNERQRFIHVLLNAAKNEDYSNLLKFAEGIAALDSSGAYDQSLERLENLIRDCWLIAKGEKLGIVEDFERLNVVAEFAGANKLARWIEQIVEVRKNLRFNLNRKIASDALVVSMANA